MCIALDCCMESNSQRFDQSSFQCAYIIWQFEAKSCLMCYILLKYSINRWCCKEYNIRTQIIFSFLTEFTVSAGFSRFQCNSVANFQMCYIFSYFYHNAPRFMSQYKWRLNHIISDCPCLIIMKIGTADSYIIQFY